MADRYHDGFCVIWQFGHGVLDIIAAIGLPQSTCCGRRIRGCGGVPGRLKSDREQINRSAEGGNAMLAWLRDLTSRERRTMLACWGGVTTVAFGSASSSNGFSTGERGPLPHVARHRRTS